MTPSVEFLASGSAVAFTSDSANVFREQSEILPVPISDSISYIPWGYDNQMPYRILNFFDTDETLGTCLTVNAEMLYAGGLRYVSSSGSYSKRVEDFMTENPLDEIYYGQCLDLKALAFAVSVITLSPDGSKITAISRREACYCRFPQADSHGNITEVYYANWRLPSLQESDIERIPLLDPHRPLEHLRLIIRSGSNLRKFALVSRIPTTDSTYYPIPYWAALLKGKWYNIKQLIAVAKESKLRNSAPIKYHIEIAESYWNRIFRAEKITDPAARDARVAQAKQEIIDFLSTAENAGKVWFSQYYQTPDGRECHDVKISKIDDSKEGGDWASDLQEAINMICFTMRIHSNLVGSVPGKSQSNNSGSDKRELYTIAQTTQLPYRHILFKIHHLIIAYNGFGGFHPHCPIIQLTTLDQHTDCRQI